MKATYKRFTTNPNLNINFFEKIDSEEKAYILGMFYADGNIAPYINKYGVVKSYKIRLRLAIKDEQIVRDISKLMLGYDAVIIRPRKEKNWQSIASFQIGNKKLGYDLIKLGCVPNKSAVLRMPTFEQVPKEYYRHFVRGFFDGDGHAGAGKNAGANFTSNKFFCEQLRDFLLQEVGIQFSEFRERKNGYGSIYLSGKDNTYKLYKYIYDDCQIAMARKQQQLKDAILYTSRKEEKFTLQLVEKYKF